MRSLWIGPLGRLREIPEAAEQHDRTVELGVSEFAALSGGITTTRLATPPRRLTLAWGALSTASASWVAALALGAAGPGPLAVLDPTTSGNLLETGQSMGVGPAAMIQMVGWGTLATRTDGTLTVTDTRQESQLYYRHPHWGGYPVLPGVRVWFTAEATAFGASCLLSFFDATGTAVGGTDPAPIATAVPPPGAVMVTPKVQLPVLTAPTLIGGAVLRLDDPVTEEIPPFGDGCPAMTVTDYADTPRLPHRDMTLHLVEVRRARR
ncbi:hypothetical protein [Actinosynnema mirum]|uniref:Uncharacterized protein n=1 Tax=Actinosynnema mirum (strain ATCC 29888 / DSM 43827 / JCM 3225 / NBRC 14064 / NCIMB 13271 / NRRL B-12336 / IMRU 3971 / 101) TaxID=446462 RepID=C6W8Q5_ACTMD|nr:hypothetical protein [Actinosynnema mirum]ACU37154.1 hypothetical protein Amir_3247 [Actinosynnema mirum DSM 43827]